MSTPEAILNDILQTQTPLRAEPLIAQYVKRGLPLTMMGVQADSFFYRTYSNDLYRAEVTESTTGTSFLNVHLSRQGLYDMLPEGLFFQPEPGGSRPLSASDMAEESRLNKKKETEIRRFFAPLEHEFFLHALQNELVETELLSGLRSGWLKEYFVDFWNLPADIPVQAALVLVMFFPYAHHIAGNLEATGKVLEQIIYEPVNIKLNYASLGQAQSGSNILGQFKLGSALTCGEGYVEQYPHVQVCIGPLQKTKAADYLGNGKYFLLLQTFYNYFIPANAEVETQILLNPALREFILHNEGETLLGISTVL